MGDKTMSDDLRDAAELLLRRCRELDVCLRDPEANMYDGATTRGMWRLAAEEMAAALSHPPDDAEPVTAEWLVALGFASDGTANMPTFSLPVPSTHGGPVCYLMHSPYMGCDGWAVGGVPGAPDTLLPDNFPTRGHVRKLLAALGIEVPDGR